MALWTDTNTPTLFSTENIQATRVWSIWELLKIVPLNIKALPEPEDLTKVVQFKKKIRAQVKKEEDATEQNGCMEKCAVSLCPGTTGPASERDNVDKYVWI